MWIKKNFMINLNYFLKSEIENTIYQNLYNVITAGLRGKSMKLHEYIIKRDTKQIMQLFILGN